MAKYSKAHEREESAKMWRGCWHSTFGILLCWVPLLGLILSISGLAHQVVRLTEKHKGRMAVLIVYALLSLAISIGAIVGGLYQYSRNPNILTEIAERGWTMLTGQESLPGSAPATDSGRYGTGLGSFTDPSLMIGGDEELGGDEDVYETLTAEEDDEFSDEEDEDYIEIDFGWEVVADQIETEGTLERCVYKVIIDEPNPKDEELLQLFEDVCYEDGFDLHTVLVYGAENEIEGDYTIASMTEETTGQQPALERASGAAAGGEDLVEEVEDDGVEAVG